jgi:hypothetical protein
LIIPKRNKGFISCQLRNANFFKNFLQTDGEDDREMGLMCPQTSLLGDFSDFVTSKRRSQGFTTKNSLRNARKNLK